MVAAEVERVPDGKPTGRGSHRRSQTLALTKPQDTMHGYASFRDQEGGMFKGEYSEGARIHGSYVSKDNKVR